jgi:hypothetical protein
MPMNISRRQFLAGAAGVGAAASLGHAGTLLGRRAQACSAAAPADGRTRKLIVILFGGGTRSSESVDDPEHRYIPRLWSDMVPKGTLFTNMRVEHKVVHPNSAGSTMTGHWEWDDIDWTRPVAHPTIFEIYRKARSAPDTATWAFVYASILEKTGESLAAGFGKDCAANVVTPPTIPRTTAEVMDRRMQMAASLGSKDAEIEASAFCQRLARKESQIRLDGLRSSEARRFVKAEYGKWRDGAGTTSHDVFLANRAIASLEAFAPDVMTVAFGEIDCAHYGSWSRYTEAIRRTDELTWRIWRAAEELPEYRGRTLLLILPDHGRQLDRQGHWGFIHHSNFYTNEGADEGCRRVWMLALGPGAQCGGRVDRPVPITAAAATGLEFMGLEASAGAEPSVRSLMADG